ncbi:outer membrane beta-barrel protein [Oceanicaulis alexandrii]|uniref:outer membrane beta-barrel protein n=1 Tax=Oceanicaulis alexandrii TaxID=153233 RepID=UPI0035D0FAFF
MMMKLASIALLTLAGATLTPQAEAQTDSNDSMFARDKNVSVLQRPRPDYDAGGVQNGALLIYPELTLGLEFTDNVFGTSSNEESDTIAVITPAVSFNTTWSRHAVSGDASVTRREHFDFSDESVWNFTAGAGGQLDITREANLVAGARYSSLTEPRTSAGAAGQAAEPIEYDTWASYIGGERASGRLRALGRVDYSTFDYDDAPLFGGGIVDQDFRDRDELVLTGRGDYAMSPDTALFARLRYNDRAYDLSPPDVPLLRDSDGYTFDVGADFDIRGVARGVIGVGYTEQDYESPALPDIDGLSVEGLVEWFPTQLTTVSFNASRSVQDSAVAGSGGFFGTSVGVNVDHELRRNVIISAGVSLSEDDYSGIDRTDERLNVTAGVTYFVNRTAGIRASFSYQDQDSSGAAGNQDFSKNVIGLSLVLRR